MISLPIEHLRTCVDSIIMHLFVVSVGMPMGATQNTSIEECWQSGRKKQRTVSFFFSCFTTLWVYFHQEHSLELVSGIFCVHKQTAVDRQTETHD